MYFNLHYFTLISFYPLLIKQKKCYGDSDFAVHCCIRSDSCIKFKKILVPSMNRDHVETKHSNLSLTYASVPIEDLFFSF